MIDRSISEDSAIVIPATQVICSQKEEQQRGFPIAIARMMGLETAANMLGGKAKLADEMRVSKRALDYKLCAQRGVSNIDIDLAASALEARAERLLAHARKLRAEILSKRAPVARAPVECLHRWIVELDYRHDDGIRTRIRMLDELAELHDLVETGPDWYALAAIRIAAPRLGEPTTVERAGAA